MRDDWRPGDTCNLSIGQGFLTVTPIQMATMASTIANGGTVYRPRLVLEVGPAGGDPVPVVGGRCAQRRAGYRIGDLVTRMDWSSEALALVRGGMRDVVMAPTGTGKRARIEGVEMAGKTGTAEYGPVGARRKHAWMLIFAPVDEPRYALAMVVEDAVSGGTSTAPRVRQFMQAVFYGQEDEPEGLAGSDADPAAGYARTRRGGLTWN